MQRQFNLLALLLCLLFLSGCIISHSPPTAPLLIEPDDSILFTITGLGNYTQWHIDGAPIPGAGQDDFLFQGYGPGIYRLSVIERGGGLEDSREWTITVNHKPAIWGTPDTSVEVNTGYAFTPSAEDLDGEALIFAIQNKPDWAEFDSGSGELSGTPAGVASHPNIIIGVTDGTWDPVWLPPFSIEVTALPGCTDGETRQTTCGNGACASTGVETCSGGAWGGDTCTPGTPSIETCDNMDNDCDGATDEDLVQQTVCGVGACERAGEEVCVDGTWTGDTCLPGAVSIEICDNIDNDCDGDIDEDLSLPTTCGVGACTGNTGLATCSAGVWNDNCDPLDGATDEVCNNLDDNCNGAIDDGIACDCTDGETRQTSCGFGACASSGEEACVDGTWGGNTCTPGTPSMEVCDNLDNDCDGLDDEDLIQQTTCGLGVCEGNTGVEKCNAGAWENDTCDPLAGALDEICDALDNDCDGEIDEGVTSTYFADNDADGFGDADFEIQSCEQPSGHVTTGTDCDDTDPSVYPGAPETECDRIDQDCDGSDDGIYAWQIEPVLFDFGRITQEKAFTVQNTGTCPIEVTVDNTATADWAAVNPLSGAIDPGSAIDVMAAVDRSGFDAGSEYATAFTINSTDVSGGVAVDITASAGHVKLIFCIDTSTSMADNDPENKRVEAVRETIDLFHGNPFIAYKIIQFNTNAIALTGYTIDYSVLMNNADTLSHADGCTTYLCPLKCCVGALDLVDAVIDDTDTDTDYVVLFLSDGKPDYGNTDHDAIVSKVADIASPPHVNFYTVFLVEGSDPVAFQLLDDMAAAGGTGGTHVYDDIVPMSFIGDDL